MILYFSGTGNSRYVAGLLARYLDDELVSLNDILKRANARPLRSEKPFIIVTPTYCYRIPPIVEEYLRTVELYGCRSVYFVMTCGAGIGSAGSINKALCREKELEYKGTAKLVMPDNYIAMYDASSFEEAQKLIDDAPRAVSALAQTIAEAGVFESERVSIAGKLGSGIGNRLFYDLLVKPERFSAGSSCTGCGECARLCPENNISLTSGKPEWGADCVHCMACISACPGNSIEYGKGSASRRRYYLCENGQQKTP